MALFRVVRIKDNQELRRYLVLDAACVDWVKDSLNLRVEELPTGTATEIRLVTRDECCTILRRWLTVNKSFISEDERNDMERVINEACKKTSSS